VFLPAMTMTWTSAALKAGKCRRDEAPRDVPNPPPLVGEDLRGLAHRLTLPT
jgi:hypothetical protein